MESKGPRVFWTVAQFSWRKVGLFSFHPNPGSRSDPLPSTWRMGSQDGSRIRNIHGDRCCPLNGVVGPLINGL